MKIVDNIKQNTPEWEQWRKDKIGASDAPIILGVSPWKTPFQLWEEKLGIRASQQKTAAMQRGHELESTALEAYNEHTGNLATPEVCVHPDLPWMAASLDGLSLDGSIAVEIKCPGQQDHSVAANGMVPEKYYPQLQHQLAVIGLNLLHYFSYSEDGFHLVEVPRDEKYIKKLLLKEKAFWEKLNGFEPPELSDRDYVQRTDPEWTNLMPRLAKAMANVEEAKAIEKELREQAIALTGGKSCQGAGVRLQKIVRKGAVDYKAIPELESIDVEKYRKPPSETWRLKLM